MHQRQLLLLKVTCCTVLFLLLLVLGWSPTAFASEKSPMAPNIIPVGRNTAFGAPSLWNFGGILYLAWTGTDTPQHLYIIQATQSSSGGLNFANQRQINDTTIGGIGPTLASFNGHLYLSWLSSAGDGHIYLGWYNNSSTLVNHASFAANACSRPAMVSLNGTLYIAWKECGTSTLDIASSGDGFNFNIQHTRDSTHASPAMQISNGYIYITWVGTNFNNNIYLGTYPGFGNVINHVDGSGQLTDTTRDDMSMAPYSGNNALYLGWRGSTNTNLYIGYYQFSLQLGTTSLNIPSSFGPGMSTSFGHFYVAWVDTAGDQLDIAAVL